MFLSLPSHRGHYVFQATSLSTERQAARLFHLGGRYEGEQCGPNIGVDPLEWDCTITATSWMSDKSDLCETGKGQIKKTYPLGDFSNQMLYCARCLFSRVWGGF